MPLFLGVIGIVLVICAINNTLGELSALVRGDFTGPNNFLIWLVALAVVGLVGYIPRFKPVSYAFFVLIFAGIILANEGRNGGGLFANFFKAIQGAGTDPGTATGSGASSFGEVNVNTILKIGASLSNYLPRNGMSGSGLGGSLYNDPSTQSI